GVVERGVKEVVEGAWPGEWRREVVNAVVWGWIVRVGLYTTLRLLYYRRDSRFDEVRDNRRMLLQVFALQAVWITYQMLPLVALNSVPPELVSGVGWYSWRHDLPSFVPWLVIMGWFWLGLYAVLRGSCLEMLADWQLTKWRWEKDRGKHNEAFCRRGLWNRR
ncbi:hypothetical protein C8A05DRAFT_38733, partial [Staphylotrichum tortipilum]